MFARDLGIFHKIKVGIGMNNHTMVLVFIRFIQASKSTAFKSSSETSIFVTGLGILREALVSISGFLKSKIAK